jgi:pyruvate ferredoxin oxidoreductase gamma subunit
MFQVRIHGRGGPGLAGTADLLSTAASVEGHYARVLAGPGAERPGAPAEAYFRIAHVPFRLSAPVLHPSAVIVQDPTVRHRVDLFAGLELGGFILVNSMRDWDGLGLELCGPRLYQDRAAIVPATQLALEHTGLPLAGVPLAGAFAALTGIVSLDSVVSAICRRLPVRLTGAGVDAARAAYAQVRTVPRPVSLPRPVSPPRVPRRATPRRTVVRPAAPRLAVPRQPAGARPTA